MPRHLPEPPSNLVRSLPWLVVALVAASCGAGPTASPTPSTNAASSARPLGYEEIHCYLPNPVGVRPEGYIRSCGWLHVPENRADPRSRAIRLQVVIVASKDPDPPPDPILVIAHGIGGSTIEVSLDGPVLESLRSHRDVVLVDGRGSGLSLPSLNCGELDAAAVDGLILDRAGAAARQMAALRVCHDRLVAAGTDLAGYSSAEIADDMEALRTGLGYTAWNVFGISYGTREELELMRSHPAGIRSVVLDSVQPADVDSLAEWGPNGERALETLFAGCAADPTCASGQPDLPATFDRLVTRLDAKPMTIDFEDPWAGVTRTGRADGDALVFGVYNTLYDTAAIGALPKRIAAIEDGDTDLLQSSLALGANAFGAEGVFYPVFCADNFVWTDAATIRAAAEGTRRPRFLEPFGFGADITLEGCAIFGAKRGDPAAHQAVTSAIPTLVLSGEYDPITPPIWGRHALATLGHGSQVVVPGVGHGVLGTGDCAERIVNAFLADPSAAVDASCATNLDWPTFR